MCSAQEKSKIVFIYKTVEGYELAEIFNDRFMETYTNFFNFKSFMYSSIVWIDWNTNPVITNEHMLNEFVAGSTRFQTWKEMLETALFEKQSCPENKDISIKIAERKKKVMGKKYYAIKGKCVGCRGCYNICPVKAVEPLNEIFTINPEKCVACGKCADYCPLGTPELVEAE